MITKKNYGSIQMYLLTSQPLITLKYVNNTYLFILQLACNNNYKKLTYFEKVLKD